MQSKLAIRLRVAMSVASVTGESQRLQDASVKILFMLVTLAAKVAYKLLIGFILLTSDALTWPTLTATASAPRPSSKPICVLLISFSCGCVKYAQIRANLMK